MKNLEIIDWYNTQANELEKLKEAKKNILWLREHPDGLVNMHSLTFWIGERERLREEIKKSL